MKVVAAEVNEGRVEAVVEALPRTERARAFAVDVADAASGRRADQAS
jgi:hypothetical protein